MRQERLRRADGLAGYGKGPFLGDPLWRELGAPCSCPARPAAAQQRVRSTEAGAEDAAEDTAEPEAMALEVEAPGDDAEGAPSDAGEAEELRGRTGAHAQRALGVLRPRSRAHARQSCSGP